MEKLSRKNIKPTFIPVFFFPAPPVNRSQKWNVPVMPGKLLAVQLRKEVVVTCGFCFIFRNWSVIDKIRGRRYRIIILFSAGVLPQHCPFNLKSRELIIISQHHTATGFPFAEKFLLLQCRWSRYLAWCPSGQCHPASQRASRSMRHCIQSSFEKI